MTSDNNIVSKNSWQEQDTGNLFLPGNKQLMHNLVRKAHEDYLTDDRLDIPRREKIIKPVYYYIAAGILAIAIFIGVYITLVLPSEQIDSEKIYSDFYKPYKPERDISVRGLTKDDDLRVAYIAYVNNKYALASELFDRALKKQADLTDAIFYRGISFMETGQHKQSIESFNLVIQHKENEFISQAHWYTALTWIKLNSPKEARKHLLWLKENDPAMQQNVQKLISRIGK